MQQRIRPHAFEEYLILGLDRKWNTVFDRDLSFKVVIDKKGRLQILSEQIVEKQR